MPSTRPGRYLLGGQTGGWAGARRCTGWDIGSLWSREGPEAWLPLQPRCGLSGAFPCLPALFASSIWPDAPLCSPAAAACPRALAWPPLTRSPVARPPGGCQDSTNRRAADAAFVPSGSAEEIDIINAENLGCDVEIGDGPRDPRSAHLLGMERPSPGGEAERAVRPSGAQARPGLG